MTGRTLKKLKTIRNKTILKSQMIKNQQRCALADVRLMDFLQESPLSSSTKGVVIYITIEQLLH